MRMLLWNLTAVRARVGAQEGGRGKGLQSKTLNKYWDINLGWSSLGPFGNGNLLEICYTFSIGVQALRWGHYR